MPAQDPVTQTVQIAANTLTPTIQAAQQFETLGITGVLFLIIVVLGAILVYKTKNNSTIVELANSIQSLISVNKETIGMLQQLNTANNALIMQKIEYVNSQLDKIESNIKNLENIFYRNSSL